MKRPGDLFSKRPLTAEEKRLWRYITRYDTPLHEQEEAETPAPAAAVIPSTELAKPVLERIISVARPMPFTQTPLTPGQYAGVDGSTAHRFRRGDYPIDAVLDLHGQTRDHAHASLQRFVLQSYSLGRRCILVITGKGLRGAEGGILRAMVPQWLGYEDLRPYILAVDSARQKHGGEGAYYILLKRHRPS